jgi:hypothetical protein
MRRLARLLRLGVLGTVLGAGLTAGAGRAAGASVPAGPLPAQVWNYTLLPGSTLTDDCVNCDRLTIALAMRGTFQLRLVGANPLTTTYAVEVFSAVAGDPASRIYKATGSGTYTIGGEVALIQTLALSLQIDDGFSSRLCHFTNADSAPGRLWPMLKIHLDQTNGTDLQIYRLDIAAAPFREIWFSTAHGFHAGIWDSSSNYVSPGDLVSSAGRVVKRNQQLSAGLGIMPMVPDLGLDAVKALPGGETAFSIEQGIFSETLGPLQEGDLLSDRGRIVSTYASLISPFVPGPPPMDQGLDGFQIMSAAETCFSIRTNFWSERLGRTIRRGDLLSSQGLVVRANEALLAPFQPADPKQDYGLRDFFVWPSGEIWFCVEQGFYGPHFESYLAGDLLSDQGYVVYRNLDLLAPFQPLEDLADFGLDALFVFSDAVLPPTPAAIGGFQVDRATGNLTFQSQDTTGFFQLEKASSVLGPWVPWGPITGDSLRTDPGALGSQPEAFYRLQKW